MSREIRHNKITSKEKMAQVNPFNLQLMEDFLLYLASVQRSPRTIKGYRDDLKIIFCYILDNLGNKKFTELTKREIVRFQNWMINENGNSPARVRRIKAVASSLSNYISDVLDEEDEFKDFRPIIRKIESPALQNVQEKTVWEDEELEALLDELTEKGYYRRACWVALGMYSGRRKAELLEFKVSDFDEENLVCDGALYKTKEPIKTKGRGLGKYIYCYTLANKFRPYLQRWLEQREKECPESEWLFPNANDPIRHMSEQTTDAWCREFSKMTGKNFYAHSLRHYFATYLAKSGIPDGAIQKIVGWESADMVGIYKDIEAEDEISMYFKDGEIDASKKRDVSDL